MMTAMRSQFLKLQTDIRRALIHSLAYFAAMVSLAIGCQSPQFQFDQAAETVSVYWDYLTSATSGRVSFGVNGCLKRYDINRAGFALNIVPIIVAGALFVRHIPMLNLVLDRRFFNRFRLYPFVQLTISWIACGCAFVSAMCSVVLFHTTLCGSAMSDLSNGRMAWGFYVLCVGCVVMAVGAGIETWYLLRARSLFEDRDDELDLFIRSHRRFLLQILNHSKLSAIRNNDTVEVVPKGRRAALEQARRLDNALSAREEPTRNTNDDIIVPAVREYRDAIVRLQQTRAEILAAPEGERTAMVAAIKPVPLSPEALFVQHVHRLMPLNYRDEVIQADAPPPEGADPFDCGPFDRLARMVERQVATARKMVKYGMTATLRQAMIADYKRFLQLAKESQEAKRDGLLLLDSFIVPTMAIDVVWHAHMGMNPKHYLDYTLRKCGFVLNHSDEMTPDDLETQRAATARLWESKFRTAYPTHGKAAVTPKGSSKPTRVAVMAQEALYSKNGQAGASCALPIIVLSTCSGFGGCGTAGQHPASCGASDENKADCGVGDAEAPVNSQPFFVL